MERGEATQRCVARRETLSRGCLLTLAGLRCVDIERVLAFFFRENLQVARLGRSAIAHKREDCLPGSIHVMTKVSVPVLRAKFSPDKLQRAVDSPENERFPSVYPCLAGPNRVFIIPAQRPTLYLMPSKPNSIVITITILHKYLQEAGAEVTKVKVLVGDWVGDVPAVRVGSIEGTRVLSEPVNVCDTSDYVRVSLYGDSLEGEKCNQEHTCTVPPSGNLTSARVSHACSTRVARVSHACRTRVPRVYHVRVTRIFVRVRTYVRPATTRAHRTFAPRYVPFYHALLMYMHEACARCKYFTVDKTSSIASLPLDRSYIHVRT